jgi:hypothetical protein
MEFVLITVENPAILSKRINVRAESEEAIGAPPMPEEMLQGYFKSCNSAFFNIVKMSASFRHKKQGIKT